MSQSWRRAAGVVRSAEHPYRGRRVSRALQCLCVFPSGAEAGDGRRHRGGRGGRVRQRVARRPHRARRNSCDDLDRLARLVDVQRAVFQPVAAAIFLMTAAWLGVNGTLYLSTFRSLILPYCPYQLSHIASITSTAVAFFYLPTACFPPKLACTYIFVRFIAQTPSDHTRSHVSALSQRSICSCSAHCARYICSSWHVRSRTNPPNASRTARFRMSTRQDHAQLTKSELLARIRITRCSDHSSHTIRSASSV